MRMIWVHCGPVGTASSADIATAANHGRAAGNVWLTPALNIVIEMELVRMRAQPDGIDLLIPLVAEPGFDHVLGENVAAQQKGVIGFKRIKRLLRTAR